MKIPSYLHNIRLPALNSPQKSVDIEALMMILNESEFLIKLQQMKKVFKSENNEPSQIISLFDRFDEYLAQFLSEIALQVSNSDEVCFSERRSRFGAIERKILVVLKGFCWILRNKAHNRVFQSLDRIIRVLTVCDDFEVLTQCMLLMYGYFSDDTVMSSSFLYVKDQMEDLLYLCKYTLNHLNSFSNKSVFQFTDYFRDDPKYPFFRETILRTDQQVPFPPYTTSLEFHFLLHNESSMIQEASISELSESNSLVNSFSTVQFLQKKYNHQELAHPGPFSEQESAEKKEKNDHGRMFYGLMSRVRFAKGHQHFEQRLKSMEFILGSLQTYVALTKLYSLEKSELLNQVFVTNLDFGNVLKEILHLFYLELSPRFHTKVLMTILNILSLDDHFDFKEYMNQINNQFMFLQKLFKDCLSRKLSFTNGKTPILSINREKNRILSEKTALNSRFLDKLLLLLKKEIKQFYLDEENNIITTQIYSMCTLLGSLMEMNDTEFLPHESQSYFLYTYKHLLVLNEILWNLIPNQDLLNNYNLFEKLIERLTKDLAIFLSFSSETNENCLFFAKTNEWLPLKINKLAVFVEYMIKLIDSPFFRKISMRNQMVPTLARKIADSDILIKLKCLLESSFHSLYIDKIFLQTITLVGDIAREIPALIDRLIELGIMKAILFKIDTDMPRNVESIPMVIYFINMLCLNEHGQLMEIEMDSLTKVFRVLIRRDFIDVLGKTVGHSGNKCPSSMAYEFLEMLNSVEKLKPRVCELILWTFRQMISLQQTILKKFENHEKLLFLENESSQTLAADSTEKSQITSDFPISIIGSIFTEEATLRKDFIDVLRDYNRVLQNFLRFFSRFFSVNCNIIDELINGHCIDLFLELLDSPLLLFSEKNTVFHSFSNCYKVFIMNIYKLDLNEKIVEEIQKTLDRILELSTKTSFDDLKDFDGCIDLEIYQLYLSKGLLDETVKIQHKSMIFLGKLLALENLSEFLRLMVTSKHLHDESSNISNEGLLRRFAQFFPTMIGELQRMGVYMFTKDLIPQCHNQAIPYETLGKTLNITNPLFHILKKVFLQNLKELLDAQLKQNKENPRKTHEGMMILIKLLHQILDPMLQDLHKLLFFSFTEDNYCGLYRLWLNMNVLYEFVHTFFEPSKKNIATHPEFTVSFTRTGGFHKIMNFYSLFLRLLKDILASEETTSKKEQLSLEILKKIQQELIYLMKTLFFVPLEVGFLVYFPERDIEESNDPVMEHLHGITLEQLQGFSDVLMETRELYVYAKLHNDFKPLVDMGLSLLIKAVKTDHHNYRKPAMVRKRSRFNNFLVDELVQMGFDKEKVEEAFENVLSPTVQSLTDWLLSHPEKEEKKTETEKKITEPEPASKIIEENERTMTKKVNSEEFLSEKKQIFSKLADDFISKIYFLQDFDESVYDFLRLLLEKSEFEGFRKPLSNKYLYLILRAIKRTSQALLKRFNFKLGLKGNRELLDRLKESEIIQDLPPSIVSLLELTPNDLLLRNLNILLPFYCKITHKLAVSEKAGLKLKPILEILKIPEKLLENEEDFLESLGQISSNSFSILHEFLLKVLFQAVEVLDLQEKHKDFKIADRKKLRSNPKNSNEKPTDSDLSEFYNRLFPLLIKMLSLHNALLEKHKEKILLIDPLPTIIMRLVKMSFQLPGAKDNIRLFLGKKGLHELLRTRTGKEDDFARSADLLRKIIENILFNDTDLLSVHYELEIKHFFLEKTRPDQPEIEKKPSNEPNKPKKDSADQINTPQLPNSSSIDNISQRREASKDSSLGQNQKRNTPSKDGLSLRKDASSNEVAVHNVRKDTSSLETMKNIFKKEVLLNEFLGLTKGNSELNVEAFEEVTKRICVKSKKKNDSSVRISLKSEFCDLLTVNLSRPAKHPPIYISQSIYQPFPDSHTLVFSPTGLLMSIIWPNISQSSNLSRESSIGLRKSSRKISKSNKKQLEEKLSKGKSKEKVGEKILAVDYIPSEGVQSILGLLIDNITTQFLEEIAKEEEENTIKLAFSYPFLIKTLHALLHKFPVLAPFVLKYNCGKHLKKQQRIRFDFDYKEISFLSFLLRVLLPLTLDHFRHLVFELCLDTYLYCSFDSGLSSNNTEPKPLIPFAQEIRKKVLLDLFLSMDKEMNIVRSQGVPKGLSPYNDLLTLISFHVYLLPIKEIARISTNYASERLSLNFLRLYEELFKLFSLRDIYQVEQQLDYLKEPLSVMYQYLLAFILNRKGLNGETYALMPTLLSRKSALAEEWEYMMNPTVFFDSFGEEHSHLHIEETVSSFSNDLDNDYSIDTFMNELYHIHSDDNPEGMGVSNDDAFVENNAIEEEEEEDEIEFEVERSHFDEGLGLLDPQGEEGAQREDDEPAIIEEEGEDSENQDEERSEEGGNAREGRVYSEGENSEVELISSEMQSDSEDDDEENESSSPSEESSHNTENTRRRHHSFFRESESDEDMDDDEDEDDSSEDDEEDEEDDEDDEMDDSFLEMRSEREEIPLGGDQNNRRRLLGSVNFVLRDERMNDGRPNRVRTRKPFERKKRSTIERSLNSILTFDYLQFDPEIQRVNEKLLEILQKSYDYKQDVSFSLTKPSEPWTFSLRIRLHKKITEAEKVLFTGNVERSNSKWGKLSRNHSVNLAGQLPSQPIHRISDHNDLRNVLGVPHGTDLTLDWLRAGGNGMVMFVSGRNSDMIDINSATANALFNQTFLGVRRPPTATFGDRMMNQRRMALRGFFNEMSGAREPAQGSALRGNDQIEVRDEMAVNGRRDLNGLRERLLQGLREADVGGQEEQEEGKENNEGGTANQIDPLFLEIMQEEMKADDMNEGLIQNRNINNNSNNRGNFYTDNFNLNNPSSSNIGNVFINVGTSTDLRNFNIANNNRNNTGNNNNNTNNAGTMNNAGASNNANNANNSSNGNNNGNNADNTNNANNAINTNNANNANNANNTNNTNNTNSSNTNPGTTNNNNNFTTGNIFGHANSALHNLMGLGNVTQGTSNLYDHNPFFNFQNLMSQHMNPSGQMNSNAQDIDNAYFFASLPPELREEVLMSSDPAFLGTLPSDLLSSEFPNIRSQHMNRHFSMNPLMRSMENTESFTEDEMWPRPKKIFFKKDKKPPSSGIGKQKDQLLKSSPYAKSILVEEKVLENVVSFLYVDSLAFKHFPFVLMKSLMIHPLNEKKLLDCFLGLLKGDVQTQDIIERDCIISDKQKVTMNISLKVLAILAVYTKHSISGYFIEKTHRTFLLPDKPNKETGNTALQDLIALLSHGEFLNSYVHLKLLIALIANISRKVKAFNEKKTSEEEKFKLDSVSIGFLCNVLNSDILDEKSLKNLNNIISVFSLNKANLQDFVSQMKFLLLGICKKMNGSLEENLIALRKINISENSGKEIEENLINRLETEIEEEHKIYRIFKIIKKLFEKCLSKTLPKKPNETNVDVAKDSKDVPPAANNMEEEKEQKPTLSKEEQENSSNMELRKTFKILISDKALNNVWINVTELLILINEVCPKSINLSNPIIHKMTPIIESFFIIYRILNDEEASFEPQHRQGSHAIRKYYSKKTMPEISALIHNEAPVINEEHELKNLLSNREKVTFNDMFTIMCEKNKNIINMMVKQNISLLNESFSMIIKKMPKILDFDNKKNYFRSELKKLKPSYPTFRLKVRRNNVFLDSYNMIRNLRTEELRRKFVIEFINEPGVDQGGLIREFYSLLSREIFNPGYCLFKTSANNVTFQPSPQSYINDQHLNYFKFVGRIFGKGLHDGYMMDAFFTRSFYKHMLGQALTIYDMEDIDPEYFKNLKWILENDISLFELTFSYESDNFGKIEIVDLIQNGRNIPVTEENKLDYVQKICYAKMAKDIQEQIKKFLEGFHELIPPSLVSIFDSRELELMISGLPDIDIQDLKDNTEYINYSKDSRVIVWLWDILSNLDKSDKAAFLQFVTGTSKVPLEGFKGLKGANGPKKFNIQKCFDATKLPSSHTCFNQLDLPDYESKETLKERLLLSIREGKEFGFM